MAGVRRTKKPAVVRPAVVRKRVEAVKAKVNQELEIDGEYYLKKARKCRFFFRKVSHYKKAIEAFKQEGKNKKLRETAKEAAELAESLSKFIAAAHFYTEAGLQKKANKVMELFAV